MFSRDELSYHPMPLPDRIVLTDNESAIAAQDFYDAMRKRHTVRDFSDHPVAREVIETCIRTAGTAPSGANHQPWHFAAVSDTTLKQRIREEAEEEERRFYAGGAGDEWIKALEPIGTNDVKEHLTIAPMADRSVRSALGTVRGRNPLQELLCPRKRQYCDRIFCWQRCITPGSVP